MELWEDIRLRCVRDREPKKRVARDLGVSPNTVRKYCAQMESPQAPHYERRSKLDPFVKVIDKLIESTPKITAKRIGAILKQQHDSTLTISAAALRKYVARRRRELVPKEAFVRAQHVPADQAPTSGSDPNSCCGDNPWPLRNRARFDPAYSRLVPKPSRSKTRTRTFSPQRLHGGA